MAHVVDQIFAALDGPTAIANGTGFPVQTVCDWRKKGKKEIPPWRRAAVVDFARRAKLFDTLSDEAKAYLTSTERTVGRAA